jgi:hypothetical protein
MCDAEMNESKRRRQNLKKTHPKLARAIFGSVRNRILKNCALGGKDL